MTHIVTVWTVPKFGNKFLSPFSGIKLEEREWVTMHGKFWRRWPPSNESADKLQSVRDQQEKGKELWRSSCIISLYHDPTRFNSTLKIQEEFSFESLVPSDRTARRHSTWINTTGEPRISISSPAVVYGKKPQHNPLSAVLHVSCTVHCIIITQSAPVLKKSILMYYVAAELKELSYLQDILNVKIRTAYTVFTVQCNSGSNSVHRGSRDSWIHYITL